MSNTPLSWMKPAQATEMSRDVMNCRAPRSILDGQTTKRKLTIRFTRTPGFEYLPDYIEIRIQEFGKQGSTESLSLFTSARSSMVMCRNCCLIVGYM